AGIFPLVHGVRSLALEARLPCTSTVERIEALRAMDRLPPDLGADLIDALHVLMGLKLEAGLQAQEGGGDAGASLNGRVIQVDALSSLQRALLKDALEVVKRFKGMLRHRYHLDLL
ncbi:MAG TPA: putative nucleotidyltransferase substrate binding domain-containing protein, partial [Albitalea sp.]